MCQKKRIPLKSRYGEDTINGPGSVENTLNAPTDTSSMQRNVNTTANVPESVRTHRKMRKLLDLPSSVVRWTADKSDSFRNCTNTTSDGHTKH